MSLKEVKLTLDNPHSVYYAGGIVSGTLSFSCVTPVKSRGISVQLYGGAYTHVKHYNRDYSYNYDTNRYESYTEVTSHYGKEVYIDETQLLREPGQIIPTKRKYDLRFSFNLPHNLPCSFNGDYGSIRYIVRYRTNQTPGTPLTSTPTKYDKESVCIVVLKLWDYKDSALPPITLTKSKTFGLFTQSQPFTIELRIQKRVFVPGEMMVISGKISNMSDTDIKHCEIWIDQTVVFRAPGAGSIEQSFTSHAKAIRPGCSAGTQEVWDGVPYYVPCLPPSTDFFVGSGCEIIKIKYKLMMQFVPKRGINLRLSEDIKIGNVPLRPGDIGIPLSMSQNHGNHGNEINQSNNEHHGNHDSHHGNHSNHHGNHGNYESVTPSAPPPEEDFTPTNDHIRSVKYCTPSKPFYTDRSLLQKISGSLFGDEDKYPPRYPVFDLVHDNAEKEFEFL